MAASNPIPPSVAALFARRTVTPVRVQAKPAAAKKRDQPVLALTGPPPRHLRRGSLLNLLV